MLLPLSVQTWSWSGLIFSLSWSQSHLVATGILEMVYVQYERTWPCWGTRAGAASECQELLSFFPHCDLHLWECQNWLFFSKPLSLANLKKSICCIGPCRDNAQSWVFVFFSYNLWSEVNHAVTWRPRLLLYTECYCPPKIHVKTLLPTVMVFGIFGRCLGHESRAFMNGINAFIKETPRETLSLLRLCEVTAKRQASMN